MADSTAVDMETSASGGEENKAEFEPSEITYVSSGRITSPAAQPSTRKVDGPVVYKMGEQQNTYRGYIAMLVVVKPHQGRVGNFFLKLTHDYGHAIDGILGPDGKIKNAMLLRGYGLQEVVVLGASY